MFQPQLKLCKICLFVSILFEGDCEWSREEEIILAAAGRSLWPAHTRWADPLTAAAAHTTTNPAAAEHYY